MTPLDRNTAALNRLAAAIEAMAGPKKQRAMEIAIIQSIVAAHFNTTAERLTSQIRAQDIARPRQIAMALCRRHLNYTAQLIGRGFKRDHTTVLWAVKTVEKLRQTDEKFARDYDICDDAVRRVAGSSNAPEETTDALHRPAAVDNGGAENELSNHRMG